MNAIEKAMSELSELEKQFARDIAKVATELEPLPDDRVTKTLEMAWGQVISRRRKLAACIRGGLLQVKTASLSEGVNRHQLNKARRCLENAKSRIGLWGHVESIVTAQVLSERRALLEKDMAAQREVRVMDQVVALFLASMHKVGNPTAETQEADAIEHGCHPDIPYPLKWFSNLIGAAHRICLALRKQRPLHFLDVGSGGGTKVLAATTCFDICDGLEYETGPAVTGGRLLELLAPGQCKLIHGDALDFSDYGKYDVIYFYRPLRERKKMAEMEERIFTQARPGTVILAVGGLVSQDLPSRRVHKITKKIHITGIYITGVSEYEASEIGKTAEQMGMMVPGFGRKMPAAGYWAPLLEVSARNGYYI